MIPSERVKTDQQAATLPAIEAVYRSSLPAFRRAAAAITGDRDLACDAVQDAFARALRLRADFRGEGSLEGWIWRIVVNTTLSQVRARRPTAELPEEQAPPAKGQADTSHVRAALALLPERQRLILFLHYYADLDYQTIAEAIDISAGTVGATLHTARAHLRRLLEEPHERP